MSAKDKPVSQPATDQYRYNWDKIFKNKEGATAPLVIMEDEENETDSDERPS